MHNLLQAGDETTTARDQYESLTTAECAPGTYTRRFKGTLQRRIAYIFFGPS